MYIGDADKLTKIDLTDEQPATKLTFSGGEERVFTSLDESLTSEVKFRPVGKSSNSLKMSMTSQRASTAILALSDLKVCWAP